MNTRYLRRTLSNIFVFFIGTLFLSACNESPQESSRDLSDFIVANDFKIELIVSEPLISDPVDMEIDESGRLFVVEMHGYPLDKSGTGKIKQLIDSDHDGKFDKATIFVEGLVLPNSIMRWKKGFIVTDAPHVLYFEDTDDDGRADKTDTLLTGFALSNPQHNLNSPLLGLDNWIYLAHEGAVGTETYREEFGDRGKEIYFPGLPNSPRLAVNAGGRSVRFQPDLHTLEMTSSHSQFGHTFDTWGHHLQVGNANHIYQEVIAERYLKRNPDLLFSNATQSLSDHGEAAEVFPITQNPQHQLLTDIGVITSACGIHAYLGGLFPAPYNHAVFVAEPVSNLIHVDEIKDSKSVFSAQRIESHKEFLASKDPKFRPVNLYTGPDGALYVVDYYRQIIEHPEWMGEEVVNSGALYNDSDKGRIYRITPKHSIAPEWIKGFDLGSASNDTLVKHLGNSNYWWRINAQRLLIDRNDKSSIALLGAMTAQSSSPVGRLHALWVLEGMGALSEAQIITAMNDQDAGVRENAIRLAELHLKNNPGLISKLVAMQSDLNPKVRFQLICTLAGIDQSETNEAVRKLLLHDIDDEWVQVAALTSGRKQMPGILSLMMGQANSYKPSYGKMISRLTAMIGANGSPESVRDILTQIHAQQNAKWVKDALSGLSDGLNDRKVLLTLAKDDQQNLVDMSLGKNASIGKSSIQVLKHTRVNEVIAAAAIKKSIVVAQNEQETEDIRATAVEMISLKNPEAHLDVLKSLISPTEPLPVQLSSVRTMSEIPGNSISEYLLSSWRGMTPELREASIRTFLDDDSRIELLLGAIETGKVKTTELLWYQKVGLMAQSNIRLRDRARTLLTANHDSEINKSYREALDKSGDAVKGKEIFTTQCGICHQVRGKDGMQLGPDLGTVHNWSKEAIMANILAPNQSISSGFELWSVEMKNGESLQGIIATETPGAITLKNINQWTRTVSRSEIKSLSALNLSVMPDDLGGKIDLQQMADLLTYLKENK